MAMYRHIAIKTQPWKWASGDIICCFFNLDCSANKLNFLNSWDNKQQLSLNPGLGLAGLFPVTSHYGSHLCY